MDEGTPLRLDQSYVKAKAGLGVPNPSQQLEHLSRTTQPTMEVADVSHLAPVAFAPRFVVRLQSAAPVGRATYQILASANPYVIETVSSGGGTTEWLALTTKTAGLTAHAERIFDPGASLAPPTLSYEYADLGTNINGVFAPVNAILPWGMLVAPGTYVNIQANAAGVAIDVYMVIQEYPGGAVPIG